MQQPTVIDPVDLADQLASGQSALAAREAELQAAQDALAEARAALETAMTERMRLNVLLATERGAARNAAQAAERRLGELRGRLVLYVGQRLELFRALRGIGLHRLFARFGLSA